MPVPPGAGVTTAGLALTALPPRRDAAPIAVNHLLALIPQRFRATRIARQTR